MPSLLRWPTIQGFVENLDEEAADDMMLTENLLRNDLSPMEEARAYEKRMTTCGWSGKEIAGIGRRTH